MQMKWFAKVPSHATTGPTWEEGRGLASRALGGVFLAEPPRHHRAQFLQFLLGVVRGFSSGFPFGGSVQARIARCPVPPQGLLRGGISPQGC